MDELGLTPRMRALLNFINGHIRKHGVSPSYEQMAEAMGLRSKSGVHRLVNSLIERGAISVRRGCARSIMPTEAGVSVPDAVQVVLTHVPLSDIARAELEAALGRVVAA